MQRVNRANNPHIKTNAFVFRQPKSRQLGRIGPFRVEARFDNVNFKLLNLKSFKEITFHVNRIVKYIGRNENYENQLDHAQHDSKRSRALLRRSVNANNINADVSYEEDSEDNYSGITEDNLAINESLANKRNDEETLRCAQESCSFVTTSNHGLSVHKGRVHKTESN